MKYLFFSDLHVKPSNIDICLSILEGLKIYVDENNIDYIFFLGDLFDNKRYIDITVFNKIYSKIDEIIHNNVKMIMMPGNHDYGIKNNDHSFNSFYKLCEIINEFSNKIIDNINFVFLPYMNNYDGIYTSKYINNNMKNILLFHDIVDGVEINNVKLKGKIDNNIIDLFDYCVGGHIHIPSVLPSKVIYLGSPYQCNFGEEGQQKGFFVYDNDFKFIKTNYPEHVTIDSKEEYNKYKDSLNDKFIRLTFDDKNIEKNILESSLSCKKNIKKEKDNILFSNSDKIIDYVKEYSTGYTLLNTFNKDIESMNYNGIKFDSVSLSLSQDKLVNDYNLLYSNYFNIYKDIKILSLHAENSLSYKLLDINFKDIVTEEPIAIIGRFKNGEGSNESGKSSIMEILYEGFFGKSIKGRTAANIVNWNIGKNCYIKVNFIVNNTTEYVIERYRKHSKHGNALYFYQKDKGNNTIGQDKKIVQKEINDIIGNSDIFKSIMFFENNTKLFLSHVTKPSERKKIIEKIIGLEWIDELLNSLSIDWKSNVNMYSKYVNDFKYCDDKLCSIRDSYIDINYELNILRSKDDEDKSIKINDKNKYIQEIKKYINQYELLNSEYENENNEFNDMINKYKEFVENNEKKKHTLYLSFVNEKNNIDVINSEINKLNKKLNNINDRKIKCDECFQDYKPDNIREVVNTKINVLKSEIISFENNYKILKGKYDDFCSKFNANKDILNNKLESFRNKLNDKYVKIESIKSNINILNKNVESIDISIKNIDNNKLIQAKEEQINKLKQDRIMYENKMRGLYDSMLDVFIDINYQLFWLTFFNYNTGFRVKLFNDIIPYIENRINCYLNSISDWVCKIELKGSNNDIYIYFNDGKKKCEYSDFSGGARNKIDFSILLALYEVSRYINMSIDTIFFDEFIQNVDELNAEKIFDISKIFIKDNDCKMFFVSHLNNLNNLFNNYIIVEKDSINKGFSEIVDINILNNY